MAVANVPRRKLWSLKSMEEAVRCVNEGKGLREAARMHGVPVETLRRRVIGCVSLDCRPGPPTMFTREEEDNICEYLIAMADMGYGLTREMVMRMAFLLAEKMHKRHSFHGDKAGRYWFEGFMKRHPNLTIRAPQPLSYSRAFCSNMDVISDFFGKLCALYGKLDILSKPMQMYNADETGISVVHKPGKVIAQLGRRNVCSITSAERGKTHTILSCVSATGFALPPMMIYPRKRPVPAKLKEGAAANTLFANSENGWINATLYLEWFKFFINNIPPLRPVLLIQDGHSSHMSIELIEIARDSQVYVLCLPAHTTHILQPLDVGVFKSFKANFSKSCTSYLAKYPGRVITSDVLASLVAEALPQSFTPVNIMSGFRKCGIYPLNPSAVKDRQLEPSKAVRPPKLNYSDSPSSEPSLFPPDQEELYRKRFEEGYDLTDPGYVAWLKINHPEVSVSVSGSNSSSSPSPPQKSTEDVSSDSPSSSCLKTAHKETKTDSTSSSSLPQTGTKNISSTGTDSISDLMSEVLLLPKPKPRKGRRRAALNSKAVCITDSDVLQELKDKQTRKAEAEKEVAERRLQREKKRQEREKKKTGVEMRRRERQKKKEDKQGQSNRRQEKESRKRGKKERQANATCAATCTSESEEDNAVCPICGMMYVDDDGVWIGCDGCDQWFNIQCTDISSETLPDKYFCEVCR